MPSVLATEVMAQTYVLDTSLARLQLAAPLSLLIFIGASMVSALVASPTLAEISDEYLTILTPNSTMIGAYWGILLLLLIGQSLLLSAARTVETKEALVYGIGARLSGVNVLMAAWVLFWTLKMFFVAEMILFGAFALAASCWATLLRYPAGGRPMDYLFIHAPVKMITVILLSCDLVQNGLLALGWYRYIGALPGQDHGKWEGDHEVHTWIALGIVLGVAVVNSVIVFVWTDFVWAASAIYLSVALAYKHEDKPPQVFIPLILGAGMVLVSFSTSVGMSYLNRRNRSIRLETEEEPFRRS